MRIIKILLITFLLSSSGYSQNSEINFNTNYLGGIDSLRHDLGKNIVNSITELDRDYFIFFEITLTKKDSIRVSELYRKPDAVSVKVAKAIEGTYTKWIKKGVVDKIIIPIFLINDQENVVQTKKIYTYTQRNYPFTNEIVSGLLIAPIIINYFQQN